MKTFYQILANTLVSSFTNMTVWFALTFFTYLETRSVFVTSITSGLYLAMVALSGFWLGSIVDHHRKKSVMILSSGLSLVLFGLAFLAYVAAPAGAFAQLGSPWLWGMIVLVLLSVIAGNLRTIALPTLVTLLVPADRRDRANGLSGTASGLSFLAVSVVSGFLVGRAGMGWVLALSCVLTAVAIVHLLFLKVPEKRIAHVEDQPKKLDIRGTIKVIAGIQGLFALIIFATFNNLLGGVFMSLMDPYGLSMVSVETWGLLWGGLSLGMIVGGLLVSKFGLGSKPLRALFIANIISWSVSSVFTLQPSIVLLTAGMLVWFLVMPFAEAAEQTIIQKVVPLERQGRVFGFAQSVEQAASPLSAFLIGPLTQFVFIPFMTDGAGARSIGGWFGTGPARGMALVFTIAGMLGLAMTVAVMLSRSYRNLAKSYAEAK